MFIWDTAAGIAYIDYLIEKRGLAIPSDEQLDPVILEVIHKNEKAVSDFRSGKKAAIGSLVGQVLKVLKGAEPEVVKEKLEAHITHS